MSEIDYSVGSPVMAKVDEYIRRFEDRIYEQAAEIARQRGNLDSRGCPLVEACDVDDVLSDESPEEEPWCSELILRQKEEGHTEFDYGDGMDPECIPLCDALNRMTGVATVESCCGHGKEPFRIWFVVETLRDLPAAIYWFDQCHTKLFRSWWVMAVTDCSMAPVTFKCESHTIGESAYKESEEIAKNIVAMIEEHEASLES